jgi:hypothetical protein
MSAELTDVIADGVRTFDLVELRRATDDFSDQNFVGSGGFGSVYKGVLKDKTEVSQPFFLLDRRTPDASCLEACRRTGFDMQLSSKRLCCLTFHVIKSLGNSPSKDIWANPSI